MMLRAVILAAVVNLVASMWHLGAWNIQKFGQAKMADPTVADIITTVVSKFDLVVIQEVQDGSGQSITDLQNRLDTKTGQNTFKHLLSDPARERYAVFYQPATITVVRSITYSKKLNYFTYPPIMLVLQVAPGGQIFKFGMIVLHTRPSLAVQEMNRLAEITQEFMTDERISDVLLGGDLNADCEVMLKNWNQLKLMDPTYSYKWLTGNEINTSTFGTCKAHDRFIVVGSKLKLLIKKSEPYCYDRDATVPGATPAPRPDSFSPCVPRFDAFMATVKKVSDHYPLYVQM